MRLSERKVCSLFIEFWQIHTEEFHGISTIIVNRSFYATPTTGPAPAVLSNVSWVGDNARAIVTLVGPIMVESESNDD